MVMLTSFAAGEEVIEVAPDVFGGICNCTLPMGNL